MSIRLAGLDRRLTLLIAVFLGAALVQTVAVLVPSGDAAQSLVIGLSAIVMLSSLGVIAWFLRTGLE